MKHAKVISDDPGERAEFQAASAAAAAPSDPTDKAALVRVDNSATAVGRAMSVDELHENLEFIRAVMQREMKVGQDYGKVPGCGDKPGLFQPGAQKLLMTFRLSDHVKSERVVDLPHPKIAGHREYAFVLAVRAQNGREWEGVGTCSTFEAKYRYRSSNRKCPTCGKETIFKSKNAGEGWFCWRKKDGCGATFALNDAKIADQSAGKTENENPADYWNTVRKMAFKRALVHAAINATNTSELWSQDLEDLPRADQEPEPSEPPSEFDRTKAPMPPGYERHDPKNKPKTTSKPPAPATKTALPPADEKSRARLIERLKDSRDLATEFFRKTAALLPNETLEDLPLAYVPEGMGEFRALETALGEFGDGQEAKLPYPPHFPETAPKTSAAARKSTAVPEAAKPIEVPRDVNLDPNSPDAPWRKFPTPFGKNAGKPLADLDKRTLFGFWANYQPSDTWEDAAGEIHKTSAERKAKDQTFRNMLDQAGLHYEFKLPPGGENAADDDVPF